MEAELRRDCQPSVCFHGGSTWPQCQVLPPTWSLLHPRTHATLFRPNHGDLSSGCPTSHPTRVLLSSPVALESLPPPAHFPISLTCLKLLLIAFGIWQTAQPSFRCSYDPAACPPLWIASVPFAPCSNILFYKLGQWEACVLGHIYVGYNLHGSYVSYHNWMLGCIHTAFKEDFPLGSSTFPHGERGLIRSHRSLRS